MALLSCIVLLLGAFMVDYTSEDQENNPPFYHDHLSPYSGTKHGSRRFSREIADCQHVRWENKTFEELFVPRPSRMSSVKAKVSKLRIVLTRYLRDMGN